VPDSPALRTLLGGSPREALDDVIELVEREHGSVREYLLASGLELSALAELENLLIEPV
jgi:protein-tyrosine phosphatase